MHSLFYELTEETQRKLRGTTVIIADIQDIIDSDPDVLSYLDQFMLSRFGQITLMVELRRQMRLLEPNIRLCRKAKIKAAEIEQGPVASGHLHLVGSISMFSDRLSFNPDENTFEYRSNANSKPSKRQRAGVLEIFDTKWAALDQFLGHTLFEKPERRITTATDLEKSLERVFFDVQQQAQWLRNDGNAEIAVGGGGGDDEEELEIPQGTNIAGDQDDTLSEHLQKAHLSTGSTITEDTPKRIPCVALLKKEKTRGTADPTRDIEPEEAVEALQEEERKIRVDQKAYRMLEIAFKSSKEKAPGEVNRNDIFHMMRAIGFTARQTGGVTFNFVHEDPSVRAITEHMAHQQKMPIQWFNNFVVRLKLTYPWFLPDSFELED